MMSTGICTGLRVVELGSGISAALAGMVFADNGADVVKVEPLRAAIVRFLRQVA